MTIPYRDALFRALTVSFSYSSRYTSWERALSLFERGAVEPMQFITHTLPLEEFGEAFRLVSEARNSVKVLLSPN